MSSDIVDMTTVSGACARILGNVPVALTPDAIAAIRPATEWKALPDWESKNDSEIALLAGLYSLGFAGRLFVVTEFCLTSKRGAFAVDARDLRTLVSEHLTRYGECFFNGDVVVVESEGYQIWLFHHEGACATISGA